MNNRQSDQTSENRKNRYTIVMRTKAAAIIAAEILSKDAKANEDTAPYYPTKEKVQNNDPTNAPKGLDEIHVSFTDDENGVIALSDNDKAVRETVLNGGYRKKVKVYDSAEQLIKDRPETIGKFISSDKRADDLLDEIR